jgi:outer membrane biosynthesis protein TonB
VTRREVSPAFLGSVLLHMGVAAALMITWPFARDLKLGAVVPVNLVSNAPPADLSAAVEAPEPQTAQAEAPAPEPEPAPETAPAAPAPTPKPAPRPEKSLDLDALAASLTKTAKTGAKPASAPRGPSRAETAPQARAAQGTAAAAAALTGLTEELQRRWNPNCDVAEARAVLVQVTFTLDAGGGVSGEVRPAIRGPQTPAARTAADRAVSAVYAAAPFRTLPHQFYGQPIRVNFDASKACS